MVISKKQTSSLKPVEYQWPKPSPRLPCYNVGAAWQVIESWLYDLKIKPKKFKATKYYVGATLKVYKATWQNQRKKMREEKRKSE